MQLAGRIVGSRPLDGDRASFLPFFEALTWFVGETRRKKAIDTKGGRRMYIGLGTVLLIVLILILLIWVF
jgi:hypothetical protein